MFRYISIDVFISAFILCCANTASAEETQALNETLMTTPIGNQGKENDSKFIIRLGGLFTIFHRDENENCDESKIYASSVEALEMTLYTLNQVNSNATLLPGVKLVIEPTADCVIDTRALNQIVRKYLRVRAETSQDGTRNNTYWGVIGPQSSEVAIPTAKLLGLFNIPQISMSATAPELSDKQRYSYFFRTTSSDTYQIMAMIQLLMHNRWEYVSFVFEDNDYGNAAFNEFKAAIVNTTTCLAVEKRIPRGSSDSFLMETALALVNEKKSNVVITFLLDYHLAVLMKHIYSLNATERFQWIGSDSWNGVNVSDLAALINDSNYRDSFNKVMDGAIAFTAHSVFNRQFNSHIRKRTLVNSTDNPFFGKYLASIHSCSLNETSPQACSPDLTISEEPLSLILQQASNIVLSFAHALHNAQADLCGDAASEVVCEKFASMTGKKLREYLRNVTFNDDQGDTFKFNSDQDGPAWYDMWRYDGKTSKKWQKIGDYRFNKFDVTHPSLSTGRRHIESVCGNECSKNQYMFIQEFETCCWHCIPCEENSVVRVNQSGLRNISYCHSCELLLADHETQTCQDVPVIFLSFDVHWAWIVASFSLVGLLLTFVTSFGYIYAWNTPIIRASGRELSSLILVGLIFAFAVTFVYCFKPTFSLCILRRLGTGLFFALVYAGILVKTIRISIIFNTLSKKLVRDYKRVLEPTPQVVIALAVTLVEVFLLTVWLIMQPPEVTKTRSSDKDVDFLNCGGLNSSATLIGLSYPILLVGVCTIYAFRVRKVPAGFNEARHIGFAVYTTLVIWIAQVPTYLANPSSDLVLRDAIYCLGISLNGLIILIVMFGPKLYIVWFKPEKNTSETVMEQNSMRFHSQSSQISSDAVAVKYRENNSRGVNHITDTKANLTVDKLHGGNDLSDKGSSKSVTFLPVNFFVSNQLDFSTASTENEFEEKNLQRNEEINKTLSSQHNKDFCKNGEVSHQTPDMTGVLLEVDKNIPSPSGEKLANFLTERLGCGETNAAKHLASASRTKTIQSLNYDQRHQGYINHTYQSDGDNARRYSLPGNPKQIDFQK